MLHLSRSWKWILCGWHAPSQELLQHMRWCPCWQLCLWQVQCDHVGEKSFWSSWAWLGEMVKKWNEHSSWMEHGLSCQKRMDNHHGPCQHCFRAWLKACRTWFMAKTWFTHAMGMQHDDHLLECTNQMWKVVWCCHACCLVWESGGVAQVHATAHCFFLQNLHCWFGSGEAISFLLNSVSASMDDTKWQLFLNNVLLLSTHGLPRSHNWLC